MKKLFYLLTLSVILTSCFCDVNECDKPTVTEEQRVYLDSVYQEEDYDDTDPYNTFEDEDGDYEIKYY